MMAGRPGHGGPTDGDPQALEAIRFRVKGEIRKRMHRLRRALPHAARESRAQAVRDRVLALDAFEHANTVLGFVAIRGELDPSPILEVAHARGKRVALPRVASPTDGDIDYEERRLIIHEHVPGVPLDLGAFQVPEPSPDSPRVDPASIDLILVPALAVDDRGHRIGYGQGFYDRLLPRCPSACSVGLAYDFQLIVEVPNTAGDVPLSVVVTDRHTLWPSDA